MSMPDLFGNEANPDLIGQVKLTREDIEPEKIDALESKRRRARQYLNDHNISVRPICRRLETD